MAVTAQFIEINFNFHLYHHYYDFEVIEIFLLNDNTQVLPKPDIIEYIDGGCDPSCGMLSNANQDALPIEGDYSVGLGGGATIIRGESIEIDMKSPITFDEFAFITRLGDRQVESVAVWVSNEKYAFKDEILEINDIGERTEDYPVYRYPVSKNGFSVIGTAKNCQYIPVWGYNSKTGSFVGHTSVQSNGEFRLDTGFNPNPLYIQLVLPQIDQSQAIGPVYPIVSP